MKAESFPNQYNSDRRCGLASQVWTVQLATVMDGNGHGTRVLDLLEMDYEKFPIQFNEELAIDGHRRECVGRG
jgi:hypothetical protein